MIFEICRMAKRKFRKVYLIVEDNKVFGDQNYEVVNLYRCKEYATNVCEANNNRRKEEKGYLYNISKPLAMGKVHGYYLVHESFFDGDD